MKKLSKDEKKKIEGVLKECSWFNGGRGLIVNSVFAEYLKENNIKGKYAVQCDMPEIK